MGTIGFHLDDELKKLEMNKVYGEFTISTTDIKHNNKIIAEITNVKRNLSLETGKILLLDEFLNGYSQYVENALVIQNGEFLFYSENCTYYSKQDGLKSNFKHHEYEAVRYVFYKSIPILSCIPDFQLQVYLNENNEGLGGYIDEIKEKSFFVPRSVEFLKLGYSDSHEYIKHSTAFFNISKTCEYTFSRDCFSLKSNLFKCGDFYVSHEQVIVFKEKQNKTVVICDSSNTLVFYTKPPSFYKQSIDLGNGLRVTYPQIIDQHSLFLANLTFFLASCLISLVCIMVLVFIFKFAKH